ncbi:hypothetical protein EXE07_18165, partial [Acinetobacter pittii]
FVCRLLHLKIISLKKPLQIGLCNKAYLYQYEVYAIGDDISANAFYVSIHLHLRTSNPWNQRVDAVHCNSFHS